MALDRLAGLQPRPAASARIVEHARDGLLERSEIAGRDETAVDAVLEVVAARDRRGARDDDRLPARHRLQQRRRRARVRVLAHGERDDTCAQQALADTAERHVDLDA